MKNVSILIISLLLCVMAHAQDCGELFVENVINTFNSKSTTFDQKVFDNLEELSSKPIEIVNIPVLFVTKKGAKLYSNRRIVKEKLLCFLNTRKPQFDESFIYSDTTAIGIISRCQTYGGIKYELNRDTTSYFNFLLPLVTKVRDISPDFIFKVYNLPQCYWYIKDSQLFVLAFKHNGAYLHDIKMMSASDYIENLLKEDDLLFVYYKPVKFVSGK
jgi:hypothetical protein